MITGKVEVFLKERMGLDAISIGRAAIDRALRERLAACGMDAQAYWQYLGGSEIEIQELIEAVVVPETWFFRDREAFTALTKNVLVAWLQTHPEGVLRVLSLPCSTGEEPFSIAMALLEAGLPIDRVQIDAVDISLRAIAYAEQGVYGKNSFRGVDLGSHARHFERVGRGHRLNDDVRHTVRFRQANLFAHGAFTAAHLYDVIFCRNVLIYFDRQSQKRVVKLLTQLLTDDGTLFIGASESAVLLDHGFTSIRVPRAFAFRKMTAAAQQAHRARLEPSTQPKLRETARSALPHSERVRWMPAIKAVKVAAAPPVIAPIDVSWIKDAQRLADQGKLPEAMELCDRNLATDTPCAQAFYLRALLHDAAGQSQQAIAHYRKALYLDPLHQDVLVHLGAALLREGDSGGAQHLFDRAKRAKREGGR